MKVKRPDLGEAGPPGPPLSESGGLSQTEWIKVAFDGGTRSTLPHSVVAKRTTHNVQQIRTQTAYGRLLYCHRPLIHAKLRGTDTQERALIRPNTEIIPESDLPKLKRSLLQERRMRMQPLCPFRHANHHQQGPVHLQVSL